MKLTIRYFASLREALGAVEEIELPVGATLADARASLVARGGLHAQVLNPSRPVRSAVNQSIVPETTVLEEGAEIAFFPPVTGG